MNKDSIRVWVFAAALLTLGACASTNGGAAGRLTIVSPPADLVVAMRERLGKDFQLGAYPENARSVDRVYQFMFTEHSVRAVLNRWDRVYAAEIPIEIEGQSGPMYVYAANPEFIDDLVYTLSIAYPVFPRQIYVHRNRQRISPR